MFWGAWWPGAGDSWGSHREKTIRGGTGAGPPKPPGRKILGGTGAWGLPSWGRGPKSFFYLFWEEAIHWPGELRGRGTRTHGAEFPVRAWVDWAGNKMVDAEMFRGGNWLVGSGGPGGEPRKTNPNLALSLFTGGPRVHVWEVVNWGGFFKNGRKNLFFPKLGRFSLGNGGGDRLGDAFGKNKLNKVTIVVI